MRECTQTSDTINTTVRLLPHINSKQYGVNGNTQEIPRFLSAFLAVTGSVNTYFKYLYTFVVLFTTLHGCTFLICSRFPEMVGIFPIRVAVWKKLDFSTGVLPNQASVRIEKETWGLKSELCQFRPESDHVSAEPNRI